MSYNLSQHCGKNALGALVVALALFFVTPANSETLPTDNEQEILVKTTLMTFNDANLTGNYSVLFDKSSKVFRSQVSAEKLSEAFKAFRARYPSVTVRRQDRAGVDHRPRATTPRRLAL